MDRANRTWAVVLMAAAGCFFASPTPGADGGQSPIPNSQFPIEKRLDQSITLAARYLVRKQGADGAWRSETYGCFKDGASLTPLVMSSVFFMPQGGAVMKQSYKRGVSYLVRMVAEDGSIKTGEYGLNFPVLLAAMASRVVALLEKTPRNAAAQQAWLKLLRSYQLIAALGWAPSDAEFGGWGFALKPPRKPKPGEMREEFAESNMVATIFGIAGLRSAKLPADDPVWKEVLTFVERCQNYPEEPSAQGTVRSAASAAPLRSAAEATGGDAKFDDGGFFFIPTDPLQNKAGVAGTDKFGRTRFHSYGSMTADGIRALIRCGLPPDHPRVVAARKWLEANFSVKHVPGRYEPDREILRDATYYYWCWSVAHAFGELGIGDIALTPGEASGQKATSKHSRVWWAETLAEELISRQRPDGSWVNRYTDAKEDDPLVATAWAAAALAICREVITGEIKELVPRRSLRPVPG